MIILLHSYNHHGPGKVVKNLKLGLNALKVNYLENTENISEEDIVFALQWSDLIFKAKPENRMLGPNICTLPIDNSLIMSLEYNKLIVPSDWVKTLYMKWIPEDKIFVWPAGVDTTEFKDYKSESKKYDCLVYFKRRGNDELQKVLHLLNKNNQSYNVLTYGSYHENQLIDLCKQSKYCFVLDSAESQGLAIEEIMSCNLPLFVWDIDGVWRDRGPEYYSPACSVPYWSEQCGISIQEEKDLNEKFETFLHNIDTYTPREYILNNLSIEHSTKKLLSLI